MRSKSLRKRFFTNSTIVTFVVMLVSVIVVDISYLAELEKTARDKLRLHIFTLLSVAHQDEGRLVIPAILQNPRFNATDSGLWATVLDEQRKPIWHSLSTEVPLQTVGLSNKVGDWYYDKEQIANDHYLTAAYKVVWDDNGALHTYHFIAAENETVIKGEVHQFRLWLFGGFLVITSILLLSQFLVLRFAFQPISLLEEEIADLEQGRKNALSANYPTELSGVTRNLNALIDKEYRQRERYRTSMADLAHSLKTPMTIIRGEMIRYADNKVLQDAICRVDNSIEYQLRRAVISGHSLLNNGTRIEQVLDMVVEALQKIYVEKKINFHAYIEEGLSFYGDENDFMELFGNLLDNAFKFAKNDIRVSIKKAGEILEIMIEDDGVGFTEKQSQKIFDRGQRLDSQNLGQGIGLAVVVDLVKNYDGKIQTGSSALGGALFKVSFPYKASVQ